MYCVHAYFLFEMDDGHSYSQAELDVDLAFEMQEFESNELVGDGLFYEDSWLLLDGQLETYEALVAEAEFPVFLNTAVRWQEHDVGVTSRKISTSKVHDRHPFLGFMSLLQNAEDRSSVYMSIPYLTDKYVIDQLCHFAKPEYGGLQFYIILGPKPFNKRFLTNFIRKEKETQIREALSRLHIKVFGTDDGSMESSFSHSNGVVSTAGAMIGSYNYSAAARLLHFEHSVLLKPDSQATTMLRDELRNGWNAIQSEEMSFIKPQTSEAPTQGKAVNPYAGAKRSRKY